MAIGLFGLKSIKLGGFFEPGVGIQKHSRNFGPEIMAGKLGLSRCQN
jgi:hypothetical protein